MLCNHTSFFKYIDPVSPDYELLPRLKKGETVTVLDDREDWWMVQNTKGKQGFTPSNYLAKARTKTIANSSVAEVNLKLLDLGCAPYVLYGVRYIDLVSLEQHRAFNLKF